MRDLFNVIMRVVSSLIALAMIAMGGIWMLQGQNIAFRRGFMVGDPHWTAYGAILAVVGLAQLIGATRGRMPERS